MLEGHRPARPRAAKAQRRLGARWASGLALSLALAGLSLALAGPPTAEAAIVERIVAVIGDKAILLSDLRARAEPGLVQIYRSVPPGAQRNAAISQLYRAMLDRLVDEELETRAAQQSKVTVSAREIEEALERVAAQNKLTVPALLAEAERGGLNERSYRDELRRQLLEAKLINVRLQGRIRVTEEDLRVAYRKLVLEERQRLSFTPAWIVIGSGTGASEQRARRKLAEALSEQARTSDFAALARQHSEEVNSRAAGGKLRPMLPNELHPTLARVAIGLEPGESSPPVLVGKNLVVLKVLERAESDLPKYEEAQRELGERVYLEKMAQAKKTWLDGLRRQHHVEVRL
jgi:peptidyl-prolyl cis-trans isomerase SurA